MENVVPATLAVETNRSLSIPMYEQSTFVAPLLSTCSNPSHSLFMPKSGSPAPTRPKRSSVSRFSDLTQATIARRESRKGSKPYPYWRDKRARSLVDWRDSKARDQHKSLASEPDRGGRVSFENVRTIQERRSRSLPMPWSEDHQVAHGSGEGVCEKTGGELRNRSISRYKAISNNGNISPLSSDLPAGGEQSDEIMSGPRGAMNQSFLRQVPEIPKFTRPAVLKRIAVSLSIVCSIASFVVSGFITTGSCAAPKIVNPLEPPPLCRLIIVTMALNTASMVLGAITSLDWEAPAQHKKNFGQMLKHVRHSHTSDGGLVLDEEPHDSSWSWSAGRSTRASRSSHDPVTRV